MRVPSTIVLLLLAGCYEVATNNRSDSGTTSMSGNDAGQACSDTCTPSGSLRCVGNGVESCDVAANGCLDWSAPVACSGNQTCESGACTTVCANPCAGGCCKTGQACIDGACCDVPCGANCCMAGAICVTDAAGNEECAVTCQTISDCPSNEPCCTPLKNASGGACLANANGLLCMCTTGADCKSGSCAPSDDGAGPYVCVADDAKPYDGCDGVTETCGPYDCWTDGNGNEFCATSCNSNSDCAGQGACCITSNVKCSNDIETCSGSGFCGPCP